MLLTLFLICSINIGHSASPGNMVVTDRGFAEKADRAGYISAFQEYVLPGAILFDHGPADIETWVKQHSKMKGRMTWSPNFSGGSLAGDLGYTSGPWIYHTEQGDPQYGHYVTIWKTQADGTCKIVLNIHITHPQPEPSEQSFSIAVKSCHIAGVADEETGYEQEKERLFEADKAFSALMVKSGFTEAYEMCTDYALKSFREGSFPIDGQIERLNLYQKESVPVVELQGWKVLGFDLAESREFGYTYGKINDSSPGKNDPHYYLRIWKKSYDGAWLVALEVIQ